MGDCGACWERAKRFLEEAPGVHEDIYGLIDYREFWVGGSRAGC